MNDGHKYFFGSTRELRNGWDTVRRATRKGFEMNKIANSLSTQDVHWIADVVGTLLASGARTATKYISDKLTIRASIKLLGKKMPPSNSNIDVVLTIGRPNFEAREFIKLCKQAKEPFPVKKIQLKFIPSRKD